MEKTMKSLVLLMIITGAIFTGCQSGIGAQRPVEIVETPVSSESVVVSEEVGVEVEAEMPVPGDSVVEEMVIEPEAEAAATTYSDGIYSETGTYESPAGPESISVNFTLEGDYVTSLAVTGNAVDETSQNFQKLFIDGVNAEVVGKKLDELNDLGAVNGSSLTPGAFNSAVAALKAEAKK